MSTVTICLGLLFLFASTAKAAVLGIDFGTLNIKAAIVKPGIPLDIVLTKDSKRKEVAAVAFKPNRDEKNNIVTKVGSFPERAYGGDALSLQGRFPSEVFPNLKLLLGLPWNNGTEETAAIYKERYPALQLEKAMGTTVFKSSAFVKEEMPFSVEELVGMQLANIRKNAMSMAGKGSVVEDAVITIPAFYTADERRAVVKAAGFAGLQVNALISDGLAVGLDYAKSRTFPEITKGETPEYHMVFDMGAGSATATVMRFQGRSVKDVGRFNKTVQEVAVVGAGWDRMLGGDSLNDLLVSDYVQKLLTKPVLKNRGTTEEDIKKNGRVMSRLFKEAERARQILSVNKETMSSFEEILPDIDLRVKVTRADFEKMADSFADRVETPIRDALKMAKLEMKDLKSVILHGGAVRTPFVQSKLETVVSDAGKLRGNVNADESAVFGAAFKAAGLSASFKVKEIRDSDIASYATSLVYTDKEKERKQPLFPPHSAVGAGATTKQVTFKDKEDFAFRFAQNVGGSDRRVLKVQSENLTASVKELHRQAGCEKDSMSTKFSIRLNPNYGLPDIAGGSVSCEVDESAKSGSVGDSVKGWLGLGKKKDQEPLSGEADADGPVEEMEAATSTTSTSGTETTSATDVSASSKAPEPPKKSTQAIPLQWSTVSEGNPEPAPEELDQMMDRLKQFDASDRARYARDEAQNVLESYTYFVRDFLDNKDYEAVSTKEQRDSISMTLQATREWMESGELAAATTEVLKQKYNALKEVVEPIQKRRTESTKRPEVVKKLQKTLDEVQKGILKIEGEAAKASSSIASAATAASSAKETEVADADDLEEPDTSEPTAKPSAITNPFDSIDLQGVQATYDSVSAWLKEKLAAQDALKPFEEPVLLTKEVEAKASELSSSLQQIVTQASKARTASRKPKTSKTKSAKKTKATADPAVEAEEPLPAENPAGDIPPAEPEAADPQAAEAPLQDEPPAADETASKDGDQGKEGKLRGAESMEDMLNWMEKGKPKDAKHDEL